MQIQEGAAHFNHQQESLPESTPTTLQEFLESKQYKLALSGSSTPAMSIIIRNQTLHAELIDAILLINSHQHLSLDKSPALENTTENLPSKLCQFFLCLGDAYGNYLLGYNGRVALEMNGKPLLRRMFEMFRDEIQINQTAVGYFYKLIDMVLARVDSGPLFCFLQQNPNLLDSVISHLENQTTVDILYKSLETANESITPDDKVQVIKRVFSNATSTLKGRIGESHELVLGLKYLCEKILDKGNVRKVGTNSLCEYILGKEVIDWIGSILTDKSYPVEVHACCFQIYNLFLKQHKISQDSKPKAKPLNKGKYFGKCLVTIEISTLSQEMMDHIISIYKRVARNVMRVDQDIPHSLGKKAKFQFAQSLELLALYHPTRLLSLVNVEIIGWLLDEMIKSPYNNLFHNCAKEVIIASISNPPLLNQMLQPQPLQFLRFLISNYIGNKKHGFSIHISLIIQKLLGAVDAKDLKEIIERENLKGDWIECLNKLEMTKQSWEKQFMESESSDLITSSESNVSKHIINSLTAHLEQYRSEFSQSTFKIINSLLGTSAIDKEAENTSGENIKVDEPQGIIFSLMEQSKEVIKDIEALSEIELSQNHSEDQFLNSQTIATIHSLSTNTHIEYQDHNQEINSNSEISTQSQTLAGSWQQYISL